MTVNVTVSAEAYTQILTSTDGAAYITAHIMDIEWVAATSAPALTVAGHVLKEGEILRISRALVSGTKLYAKTSKARPYRSIVAVTTDIELFGS